MPDVRGLLADPEFNALPMERRQAILARINPGLAQEYGARQQAPDFPGKEAAFSQGKPESAWHSAWESARRAIFGSPDREEAMAAGVGLQPTPANMVDAGIQMASMLGGPSAIAANLPRVARLTPAARYIATHPGTVNAAFGALAGANQGGAEGAVTGAALGGLAGKAGWIARNPAKVFGAIGAVEGAREDGIVGAAEGASLGAAVGKGGAAGLRRLLGRGKAAAPVIEEAIGAAEMSADKVRERVKALASAGRHAEAQNLIDDFRAVNPVAVEAPPIASGRSPNVLSPQEASKLAGQESGRRTARAIRGMSDDEARAIIEKAKANLPGASASNPSPQAAPVAGPIDRGRQAAQAHSDMVALAKEAVKKNPDAGWGAKIWIRFKNGKPVGVIPAYEDGHHAQDMAAAINRGTKKTGESAVFMRNLWGKASHLSASLD